MADGKIVIETGLDTKGIENGLGKISSLASKGLATATKRLLQHPPPCLAWVDMQ